MFYQTPKDIFTFFEGKEDDLYEQVITAIEIATKSKMKDATLMELNQSGIRIPIPREQWKTVLEFVRDHFAKTDSYECCVRCEKLLKTIY